MTYYIHTAELRKEQEFVTLIGKLNAMQERKTGLSYQFAIRRDKMYCG
jgi:hypothetical protein